MSASVQSCPPPVALPIVFVPGIMGSRLRRKSDKASIWDPDRTRNALGLAWAGASGKRAKLVGPSGAGFSPDYLEVDYGTPEGALTPERIARGWGGVLQGFYYSFLAWLEHTAQSPAAGQVPRGCFNLHYEVWAHPYNWTDDNRNSGKKLGETVKKAAEITAQNYAGRNVKVLKPIIITHSMGGLVARAYTQLHGGADKVQGVIHGAMPTDGAPATYKRIRAGFEGGGIMGTLQRHALGANQHEVTASAANLPGALELLPNARHRGVAGRANWLQASDRNGTRIWAQPNGDPYVAIYANQTAWWRLIDSDLLDPDARDSGRALRQCLAQILKAKKFHEDLGPNGFHPNTRMFYGNSTGFPAWDHIDWRQEVGARNAATAGDPSENDGRGMVAWGQWIFAPAPMGGTSTFIPTARFRIADADAPGDGTVHAGSGVHISGPMSVATDRGFEHADAFNPSGVRRMVAGWIFDLVEEQL